MKLHLLLAFSIFVILPNVESKEGDSEAPEGWTRGALEVLELPYDADDGDTFGSISLRLEDDSFLQSFSVCSAFMVEALGGNISGEKVEIFRLFDEESGRSVAHLVLDKISYGWAVDAFYSARFVSGSRTFSEERGDDYTATFDFETFALQTWFHVCYSVDTGNVTFAVDGKTKRPFSDQIAPTKGLFTLVLGKVKER